MHELTVKEVLEATQGILLQGDPQTIIKEISTDSRKVQSGELFIALKGERFDGHAFIGEVTARNVAAVLVSEDVRIQKDVSIIKVDDTLIALGAVSRFYRRKFAIPVVAITGSNGKTTTKDMLAAVLGAEWPIIKTEANFNNEIGLPLTLLKITGQTKAAVVEMGMRGLGQIHTLAEIAEPNIGVITNVGLTHLELLGSQANIAKAKSELIAALPAGGLAILNGDDEYVRPMSLVTNAKAIYYGIEGDDLDYRAVEIEHCSGGSTFKVISPKESFRLTLPVPGVHNILNALAAIAVAKELGLDDEAIQKGLANLQVSDKRLNIIKKNGYLIIDDTYNASPTSMKASLDVLSKTEGCRKIAVLSDMLELGPSAGEIHRGIGEYAGKAGIDRLFACGELAQEYIAGMNSIMKDKGEYFSSKQALIFRIKSYIRPGDVILIKGSRGMKMEEVVAALPDDVVSEERAEV